MRRRAGIVLCLLFIAFFGIMVRIALLAVDDAVREAGNSQGSRTLTVTETRGTIYDRNLQPLVNVENAYYATLLPEERLVQRLSSVTEMSEYQRLLDSIKDNVPLVARLQGPAAVTDGLRVYMAPLRYGRTVLSPHLIGYLGNNRQGIYGIEQAYNDLLNRYGGRITATFPVNGKGTYLADDALLVENTTSLSAGGVVLTLDKDVQNAVEAVAASQIQKGAVIVLDAQNGDILASASYPTFHPNSMEDALENTDGALVNRTLAQFDCGSVFKIVTALAALENGIATTQTYDCSGGMTIDENTFHCHYRLGHQALNMEEAFAQSCNLYFIQLAADIGADALLSMANRLGLTDTIVLANGMEASASILPTPADLTAPAALANLSFGQGKLLISPLHIAQMTAVIASGGTRWTPGVVKGTIDNEGRWTTAVERGGETVLSATTVATMQLMMERVITDGTGSAAQPQSGSAAGKTGTAETGQIRDGEKVIHSWFTGYYPANDPRYIITVFIEDVPENTVTAAQLFCELINNLP